MANDSAAWLVSFAVVFGSFGGAVGCNKPTPAPLSTSADAPSATVSSRPSAAARPTGSAHASASPPTPSATASGSTFAALTMTPLGDGFVYYNDKDLRDSTLPIEALIVPAKHAGKFFPGDANTAYFTPTLADLATLDKARSEAYERDKRLSKHHHRFQIVGLVASPARGIAVNAFCGDHPEWKTRSVTVLDGGACYFSFQYDPESGAIFVFAVNGEG